MRAYQVSHASTPEYHTPSTLEIASRLAQERFVLADVSLHLEKRLPHAARMATTCDASTPMRLHRIDVSVGSATAAGGSWTPKVSGATLRVQNPAPSRCPRVEGPCAAATRPQPPASYSVLRVSLPYELMSLKT
jgi:hypothetical protein